MKKKCLYILFIISCFLFTKNVFARVVVNAVRSTGGNLAISDFESVPKKSLLIYKDNYLDYGFQFSPSEFTPGEYVIVSEFYGRGPLINDLNFSIKDGYDPFTYEVTNLGNIGRCWYEIDGKFVDNCTGYRIAFFVNFSNTDALNIGYLRSQKTASNSWLTFLAEDSSRKPISVMTLSDYKIWKTQQETNEKLDDINDAVSSEDDDVNSSKCGIVCKLKNVVIGIAQLPGKIGEFIVNLGKQIGQFFSELTSSLSGFFKDLLNGIKNALTVLGDFLIEGIKGLFVPTNDQLYDIINESKELSENFGFVGESVNFFINIFTSLLGMVNQGGCVELPEFSVGPTSMFDKVTFWNKQNVCLSDNQVLNMHIDTIRTITSIVLVCLFLNFAAAKFFNILSKNDSNEASMDAASVRWNNQ